MLVASLIVVVAISVALVLPLSLLARLAIVIAGMAIGFAATHIGQNVLVPALLSGRDLDQSASPPKRSDQVTVTYEVTATVRVNGELRSGTSLQMGIISRNDFFGSQRLNTVTRFYGEAVAVPVTDGAYLLVTMRDGPGNRSYEGVITSPCRDISDYEGSERPTADEVLTNAARFTEPCGIAENRLPLMVRVADGGIDAELREATPENLSEIFGAEVQFVVLTFKPTTKPLEFHLNEQLSWIESYMSSEIRSEVLLDKTRLYIRRQDILRRPQG